MADRQRVPDLAKGPSGLTVADVAEDCELGLRVLVGGGGLQAQVLAAHTSELADPGPWLRGGEFLMTTGLSLDTSPPALAGYVARLAAAGVACLAVGTGRSLTHEHVPDGLVQMATACGLPLLEVPERTPFLAVTESVFARLAAGRYAEQLRALQAQRALTAAAVHPGGVLAVADALASTTGLSVLVTDAEGVALAASAGGDADGLGVDLAGEITRLRAHGLQATASVLQPGRDVRIQPLGSARLRGFLVCGGPGPPGPFERQLVAGAVVLLTLELERLRGVGDADRARRADVAAALLDAELQPSAAADLLASVSLRPAALRAVVVPPMEADVLEGVTDRLVQHLPGLLVATRPDAVVLLVADPPADLADVLTMELRGVPAGIGGPVEPTAAPRSALQAARAAQVAARTGAAVVDLLDLPSMQLLLALDAGVPGAATTYANAVLAPLDAAGARGRVLSDSLRAFLQRNGSWEQAATDLGVHRHTLRQRLSRVEELTGRRMDSGGDRMELLLALEVREFRASD